MTVSKITSPITPNELINKTNEIIDNLGSGGAITVDNTLSTTSTNPVQNKVITEALDAFSRDMVSGALTYSTSTNYAVGDRVRYQYQTWECTSPTTGTWDENSWTALDPLQIQIDNINANRVTSVNGVQPVNGNVTLSIPDTSNLANKDLSNLSSTGEKHFLNKSQVSNCILEAPNGVLTYSGNTITLKAGLKVLVPDGRNSDGTLKSIEVTIPNDITGTTKSYQANRRNQPLFIDSEGNFHYDDTQSDSYYITDFSSNGTYDVNYSPKTNTTKRTNGTAGSWTTVKYAYIGRVTIDSNLNVTYASIEQPINLFTNTDKKYIASLPMPSGWSIDLTLGASGTTYTAPGNGWVSLAKVAKGVGQYIEMNINNQIRSNVISPVSTNFGLKTFIPVRHGQQFTINYNAPGNLEMFKFTYAEGEV